MALIGRAGLCGRRARTRCQCFSCAIFVVSKSAILQTVAVISSGSVHITVFSSSFTFCWITFDETVPDLYVAL